MAEVLELELLEPIVFKLHLRRQVVVVVKVMAVAMMVQVAVAVMVSVVVLALCAQVDRKIASGCHLEAVTSDK